MSSTSTNSKSYKTFYFILRVGVTNAHFVRAPYVAEPLLTLANEGE